MRLGQRPPVQLHFILHHDTRAKQSLPLAPREVPCGAALWDCRKNLTGVSAMCAVSLQPLGLLPQPDTSRAWGRHIPVSTALGVHIGRGKRDILFIYFLMSFSQTWDQRLQAPSVPPVQLGLTAELQALGCFTAPDAEPHPAQQLPRDVQLTATAPDPGHPQGHPCSSRDPWKGWAGQERAGEGGTAQKAGEWRAQQCPACLFWSLGSSTASTGVLWDIGGHSGSPQAPWAEPPSWEPSVAPGSRCRRNLRYLQTRAKCHISISRNHFAI